MKRVLVTGAEGFTGRYLVRQLQESGCYVIGLGLKDSSANETVLCDLTDFSSVEVIAAIKEVDWVVHLAAISFVAHESVDAIYTVNVIGTRNLLNGLAKMKTTPKAILIASSASVYGNSLYEELDESMPTSPANDYGISKLASEYIARIWMDRLPIIITRPFNYTGVGQSNKFIIPKIVEHFALNKKNIELGNIDVEREFTDVRILCGIYQNLLESRAVGEIYNIASHKSYSLRHILQLMSEISGYEIKVDINPAFLRKDEIKRLVGNNNKLHSVIGVQEYTPLEELLRWMYFSSQSLR